MPFDERLQYWDRLGIPILIMQPLCELVLSLVVQNSVAIGDEQYLDRPCVTIESRPKIIRDSHRSPTGLLIFLVNRLSGPREIIRLLGPEVFPVDVIDVLIVCLTGANAVLYFCNDQLEHSRF